MWMRTRESVGEKERERETQAEEERENAVKGSECEESEKGMRRRNATYFA